MSKWSPQRVRDLREAWQEQNPGKTREDFAKALGIPTSTLMGIERIPGGSTSLKLDAMAMRLDFNGG